MIIALKTPFLLQFGRGYALFTSYTALLKKQEEQNL